MASIATIAPRDQVRQFVVTIKNDDTGDRVFINVEYYRNRISLAPIKAKISDEDAETLTDAELDAIQSASTMCHYVKSWDLTGPLIDNDGRELVGDGEVVPLDPRITMHLPTTFVGEVMRQLTEEVFPKQTTSRNERRRSR